MNTIRFYIGVGQPTVSYLLATWLTRSTNACTFTFVSKETVDLVQRQTRHREIVEETARKHGLDGNVSIYGSRIGFHLFIVA